ncbi:mannose receptor C type 1-like protein [Aphelenchoides avenae]|nr:mannose receptor C type 1-like protein [Aphelenchus avenae]
MSVLRHVSVTLLLFGTAFATCPNGWESNGKYCYKLNNDPSATSFDEQLASCRNQGGSLASIHDQATQQFLQQLAQSSSGPVYIGLFDPYRNGSWAWADGTPVDYTNWRSGRPDNATGAEYCGQLEPTFSGQWDDGKCCGGGAGICQTLDPDTCPCPRGWSFLPSTDSCYRLIKAVNATGFNISGAVNACKNEGSQLISIHNPQEQELALSKCDP